MEEPEWILAHVASPVATVSATATAVASASLVRIASFRAHSGLGRRQRPYDSGSAPLDGKATHNVSGLAALVAFSATGSSAESTSAVSGSLRAGRGDVSLFSASVARLGLGRGALCCVSDTDWSSRVREGGETGSREDSQVGQREASAHVSAQMSRL